jgi:flagella basal body P-ring formation protein FlgA
MWKYLTSIAIALGLSCPGAHPQSETPAIPADHVRGSKRVMVYVIKDIPAGSTIRNDEIQERAMGRGKPIGEPVLCRNYAIGRKAKYEMQVGQIVDETDLLPYKAQLIPGKCLQTTYVSAKNAIPAGTRIRPSDVMLHSMSAFEAKPEWIPSLESAIGFKTKKPLSAGQILTDDSLELK